MVLAAVDDLLFSSKIRATAKQIGVDVTFARTPDDILAQVRELKPSLAIFDGHSLFGPSDMPPMRRARIADDVAAVLRDPVVAERLTRMGYRPQHESAAAFQELLQRERAHWTQMARATDRAAEMQ